MQTPRTFPLTLIAVVILSGCSSIPQNASLTAAHNRYNDAKFNPDISNQAPLELKEASDSLSLADTALNTGKEEKDVNHLAYIAEQQVAIAEETAKRKTAELTVSSAGAKRDKVRLDARTAEADAAGQQVAIAHENADRQNTELAVADANSKRDQELLAKQDAQLRGLNAKKTERGMMITLGDVLFSTDQAQLKSGGIRNMEKLAIFLTQYPQYKVSVEGHTDSRASDDYNMDLSERRSDAVQSVLLDMSISGSRITTQGYGEKFPVASNRSAAGRQLNRRVEVVISDNNGHIIQR